MIGLELRVERPRAGNGHGAVQVGTGGRRIPALERMAGFDRRIAGTVAP